MFLKGGIFYLLLCWFGRDPLYEEKQQAWLAGGKQAKEPEKFHFVKGFQRGLELWGQVRLKDEVNQAIMKQLGLIVVEGQNDVVRLATLGIPSVALCSNVVTECQAEKLAQFAQQYGNDIIKLMLDNDEPGEIGMKQSLPLMARFAPVQLLWSRDMQANTFHPYLSLTSLGSHFVENITELPSENGRRKTRVIR